MLNILSNFILLSNAITAFLIFQLYNESTLYITLYLSILSVIASLYLTRKNLLYQIRMLIISIIGVIPALAIYHEGYFSKRLLMVQYDYIAWILSIIVCISLFSSKLGFYFADKRKFMKKPLDLKNGNKILYILILILILITGYFISLERSGLIFYESYGAGSGTLIINNTQVIVGILLIWLFMFFVRIKNFEFKIVFKNILKDPYLMFFLFALIYIVFWVQIFRGVRMDPLTILFSIFILNSSMKGKIVALNFKYFIYMIIIIIFFKFIGSIRSRLADGYQIYEFINLGLLKFREESVDGIPLKYYFIGTFSDLSVGVASTISAVRDNLVNFIYGKSYLDYILRIPPKFIYPERPETLVLLIKNWYNQSHGGGFNEMAEIYLNFGIYGSIFMPGIISYIIGYSYKKHLHNPGNLFNSLLFVAILSAYTRFLLYQTFAGFKSYITILILYSFIYIFYMFFNSISIIKKKTY